MVALDMWMPGVIALEGLEEFLRHDPAARIIMISSEFQRERIAGALKIGARDYFLKPIMEDSLKAVFRSFKKLATEGIP